jgi:uncharacterized protein (TIRG00374 family)
MRYKLLFRIALSLVFLSYLVLKIDWPSLIATLFSIKPIYFFVSLLLAILNSFILALKYRTLMKPSGLYQPFLKLVKINFVSRFYAMFLSTAIGHGVIRWYKVTKNQNGRSKFLAVMALERLTFLFAILLTSILSLHLLSNPQLNALENKILPFLWAGLAGLTLFFVYFLYSPFYNLINRTLQFLTAKLPTLVKRSFTSLDLAVFYRYYKVLLTVFFALIWHLLFLLRVYALFLSLEVPLNFIDATWMASLVLLVQVIPLSFSGIGVRETAYAYLFKMQNLPPEQGVLVGILFFSQMLVMSLIGGALELSSKE